MQCIVSDTAGLRDDEGLVDNSGQRIDDVELEGMRRARQTFNNAHVRYLLPATLFVGGKGVRIFVGSGYSYWTRLFLLREEKKTPSSHRSGCLNHCYGIAVAVAANLTMVTVHMQV